MNVKKFLILACMSLQITGYLHASQANYDAAFLAFDAAFNKTNPSSTAAAAAKYIKDQGNSISWSTLQKTATSLMTPEAQTVRLFLADGTTASLAGKFPGALYTASSKSYSSLENAFTNAGTTVIASDPNANTAPLPMSAPAWFAVGSTPSSTSAIQTAASTLKSQINSAISTYNQYLSSVSLPQVSLLV